MVLHRRRLSQHLVPIDARAHLIGAEHVGHRHGVGRRHHAGQVERGHVGGMVEQRVVAFAGEVLGGPGAVAA